LLAAGAMLASPLTRAQKPGRDYRVGVLLASSPGMERYRAALRERLAGHGFVEGKNLRIDARASVVPYQPPSPARAGGRGRWHLSADTF
jgi:hypothetical protein